MEVSNIKEAFFDYRGDKGWKTEERLDIAVYKRSKKKLYVDCWSKKRIVGSIAFLILFSLSVYFVFTHGEPLHLYMNLEQHGANLSISGKTNLPENSVLEILVPSLDVSGSTIVEKDGYEWKVKCPINAPSGNIQIIISSPLKNFENSGNIFWNRVNSPPTSDFTFTREDHTVEFVDKSSDDDGNITVWKWEFGTGEVSNDQNPTFEYSNRGIYEVKLTVTDNGGTQTVQSKTVAIPDTLSYKWTYGGRSWRQETEIVDEIRKYEFMSHGVYYYMSPIGAHLHEDAKKFVTAGDKKIKAFAENLKANYLSRYSMSEDGLADFVLEFVQEAISYNESGIKDNLYYWPYALEILAAGKGNCSDKSILYASLLEALGYHACLVKLKIDEHMMVGVRLDVKPSMASSAGYMNKAVESFKINDVEYWPAETTHPGWNLGERNSRLRTDTFNVDILPITETPVASASATPKVGEVPLEVSFSGSAMDNDGNIISYNWDFKDESTSNEQNPVHVFQTEGKYDVRFEAIDDDGETDSDWVEVTALNLSGGEWEIAEEYSGTFGKVTDAFVIQGNKFKIKISVTGDPIYGYMDLYIYPEGENADYLMRESIDLSDYSGRTASNISYSFEGAGNYYSDIVAGNLDSWTIEVYDWQ